MVKVCIIGTGRIAQRHAEAYLNNPDVKIQAVCDVFEKGLNEFADKFSVEKVYTSLEEMLSVEKDLDAADVCVWNKDHASSTIAALNAGLHVMCEKPMAISLEEAQKMVDAAKKNNKLLMIAQVARFSRESQVAKDLIEKGTLGDVYLTKAKYLRRYANPGGWFANKELSGGGPVMDIGVHVLDRSRYLMGGPKAVSVYAVNFNNIGLETNEKTPIYNVEDSATALIRYENGKSTLLETSYIMHCKDVAATNEVYGTKAGLVLDNQVRIYHEMNGYRMDTVVNKRELESQGPYGKQFMSAFDEEISHFVDCIQNGTECICTGEDCLETMRIIDAIYISAETGREVIL